MKGKLPGSKENIAGKTKKTVKKRKYHPASRAAKGQRMAQTDYYQSVADILRGARGGAGRAISIVMVEAYWNIGRKIDEEVRRGRSRAEYDAALLHNLAIRLAAEFGVGFSEQILRDMRQFYRCFPNHAALRSELTWSHYKALIHIEDEDARAWYVQEAADRHWSPRALARHIHSRYYERLAPSREQAPLIGETPQKPVPLASTLRDFIKDAYLLEFLGLPDRHEFHEMQLEQAIITKLQTYILELGKGFALVTRQHRIATEGKDFYVDLVFYNHLLKCFVLVDLTTGELTHEDIERMDMYVRLFDDISKGKDDNPTVGLTLCAEKDRTAVKYSVLDENRQLFASKYMAYLPTEEALSEELHRELVVREQQARYERAPAHERQKH